MQCVQKQFFIYRITQGPQALNARPSEEFRQLKVLLFGDLQNCPNTFSPNEIEGTWAPGCFRKALTRYLSVSWAAVLISGVLTLLQLEVPLGRC